MTTIDLDAWREREIEQYCADAASGKNDDWASNCENSSLEALVHIYHMISDGFQGARAVKWTAQEVAEYIEEHIITKAAEAHADSLLDDCSCYTPPVAYNATCPPEPRLRRDCPVHGAGEDYRRER